MLTNCLAACAHLSITVSEIERDIGRKSSFFHTPLHSTPPLGGFRRDSATPFGVEKLEWLGYPLVKKFRRYLYSFGATHERDRRDGQTDGHRMPAIAALMHSIARQLQENAYGGRRYSVSLRNACFSRKMRQTIHKSA